MKIKMPQVQKNKAKTAVFCMRLSFILLVLSLATQMFITNKFAVKGDEMAATLHQKEELQREVSLLELEIAEVASLATVETRAQELGFVEYNQPMAVISSSQFAALANF